MSKPDAWPTDSAPREAYYNSARGCAIDDYNKIRDSDKDCHIVSWVTKHVQLWDVLMSNDGINLPRIPPPPLFIDRSDDTPYVIEPDGSKNAVVGHLADSWAFAKDGSGIEIAGRSFCQLRIYEKVAIQQVEEIAGKTPTIEALTGILDRLMFHEMAHYVRNTVAWIHCYDDSPGEYSECYNRLITDLQGMGGEEDERKTEALALCFLRNYYFPCTHTKFVLTSESPWISHYVKRHPELRDYELVYRFYVCRWKLNFGNYPKAEEDKLWDEYEHIIKKLHKHGEKRGHKYHLIQ